MTPERSNLSVEVTEALATLGLMGTELRAYQFLLTSGGTTPSQVARETGQSRGRIYETLRLLVDRGLAREEPTRPVRYLPVPLSEVLALALAEAHRRAQLLRAAYVGVPRSTDAPPNAAPMDEAKAGDVAVCRSRSAAAAEVRRILSHAQQRFRVQGGGALASRWAASPQLLRELEEARGRGVRLELFLASSPGGAASLAVLETAMGAGALHRLPASRDSPLVIVASEREALWIAVHPDDDAPHRGDDLSFYCNAPAFVRAAWEESSNFSAAPAPAPSPSAQQGSAPQGPSTSPALANSWEPAAATSPHEDLDEARVTLRFLEAMAGARREVLGMGPHGWSRFLKEGWETTVPAYAAAKNRGVHFRALATDSPEERPLLEPFAAVWELRFVPWVPVWMILVDGRELFQAKAEGTERPVLRHSRNPEELRYYLDLFERLWGQTGSGSASSLSASAKTSPSFHTS